mmetsp:Transcript_15358/g.27599  ORF Transcript_15358/g.27599 Transcript_15358/m.27599 type:complete len:254 (-) Transcript_15358:109-870(-)|eukprot:CAMPEP_0197530544 /NCGR_PEP_ID=MMETSP1318-20131121/32184_1 /TAXON_ID=552666 /ORGANISM="Partenskyella glossopodia, Strain RCC365" /LENGTH=253 /DNA_ID=CAMNT_0043086433 /DNA_START=58 /DNA_END=819 /DNA_ORIENTATION=+
MPIAGDSLERKFILRLESLRNSTILRDRQTLEDFTLRVRRYLTKTLPKSPKRPMNSPVFEAAPALYHAAEGGGPNPVELEKKSGNNSDRRDSRDNNNLEGGTAASTQVEQDLVYGGLSRKRKDRISKLAAKGAHFLKSLILAATKICHEKEFRDVIPYLWGTVAGPMLRLAGTSKGDLHKLLESILKCLPDRDPTSERANIVLGDFRRFLHVAIPVCQRLVESTENQGPSSKRVSLTLPDFKSMWGGMQAKLA